MGEVIRRTRLGDIRGAVEDGIEIYRGIPYAAPPVGDLRWCPPQPAEPWKDVLDCTKYRANPVQPAYTDPVYTWEFQPVPEAGFSEDCLHLNIYTAQDGQRNKPVLVYLFGGGNQVGSANTPVYEGENLADKGAVFVTVNYRIGPFGWMTLPELRKEQGACGNYGLMDQIAALQFLKANIREFGGNPDNITFMGHSSGGCCAEYVAISPEARGLVQNVAVFSYLQINRPRLNMLEAEERVARYADPKPLEELRAMSAQEVLDYYGEVPFWSPVVDGRYIPFSTADAYKFGTANSCNMLLGSVEGDGPMASKFFAMDDRLPTDSGATFLINCQQAFGPILGKRIAEVYDPSDEASLADAVADLKRDELMCYYYQTAAARALHNHGKTFLYYGTVPLPGRESLGAYHGCDIPFWLDNVDSDLAEVLSDQLLQFARYGDPNRVALPEWHPFEGRVEFMFYPEEDPHTAHMQNTRNDVFWKNLGDEELRGDY